MSSSAASGLNDNHRRALTAAFRTIDTMLRDVESASAATRSPFSRFYADLSPTQQQVVADYVAQIRGRMTDALAALGITLRMPDNPASWAIQTNLSFAQITVQEVDPSRLKGYGPLNPEAETLVASLNSDLERGLRRLQTYLSQGLGKDLAKRLERLEAAPIDIRLLRTLERIVRERGLVEFHGALEALLERLEARTFEIAFFGRVSSGKSSLLNAVLEFDALPVGITPVTAVPTRVTWGDHPTAEIRFADAPQQEVPLTRLAEFVSESGNPENHKHVSRALVRIPSPQLREGVVFVDTPGVGSLARSGARESYAYLPRCDLGVLLIDAASSPAREDLDLIRLLYESGIPARVVISKSDLISETDRSRMREYVREQIRARLGLELDVHPVSARGGAQLARDWFHSEIAPLLASALELAEASAHRKLASLREGVAATLRASLSARSGAEGPGTGERRERVERFALEAETAIREATRRAEELADRTRALAKPTLDVVAAEIARLRASGAHASPEEVARRAIGDTASAVRREIQEAFVTARDRLRGLLDQMASELDSSPPKSAELTVDLVTLPSLSPPAVIGNLNVTGSGWLRGLPSLSERRIRRRLDGQLAEPFREAYEAFGGDLRRWIYAAEKDLANRFAVHAEPLRAEARRAAGRGTPESAEGIAADLAEIEGSPGAAATHHSEARSGGSVPA